MSTIFDLSNELLYKIIDQIHPDDIINFSNSRLHFHRLGKDAVTLHLRRKVKYENVTLHGCHRHQNNAHPLSLIQDICMDWRVAVYPKSLWFQCCHNLGRPELNLEDDDEEDDRFAEDYEKYKAEGMEDNAFVETTLQAIQGFIEEKAVNLGVTLADPIPVYAGNFRKPPSGFNPQRTFEDVEEGDREAMLVLLLLFLSNLESVCLAEFTWDTSSLQDVITWIAQQNLQNGSKAQMFLTKLTRIRFLGSGDNAEGENFKTFTAFAALPSVQKLSADFVDGNGRVNEWQFQSHISNVTEINLQHSTVNAKTLRALLVGIRALRRFTYEYDNDRGNGFKAHKIIAALDEHASHSLEYLKLTGDRETPDPNHDDHHKKGSLEGFKVLREVILDCTIYVDYEADGDTSSGVLMGPYGTYGTTPKSFVRPLIDVLPRSTEIIWLSGRKNTRDTLALFANLAQQKELRLPSLTNIKIIDLLNFRLERKCVERLREICRPLGVRLQIFMDDRR